MVAKARVRRGSIAGLEMSGGVDAFSNGTLALTISSQLIIISVRANERCPNYQEINIVAGYGEFRISRR